jgi:acetyl esterase/lipase
MATPSNSLRSAARGAVALGLTVLAVASSNAQPPRPTPTAAEIAYGPHEHQRMDVYAPTSGEGPFPVVIWFGGIWKPARSPAHLDFFLKAHCAVIAVQTRTMTDAVEDKVAAPISYVQDDACRVVQFVRLNAARWKLDGARIAVGGGSQGAQPALFVACSKDRANPNATDPVERVSSRVSGAAAYRSQPTIDPKRMQEWVPGVEWGVPALGCSFKDSLKRYDELLPTIKKWSPDCLLHPGAAPLYFENNWGLMRPDGVMEMDYKVHSPAWSLGFQKLAKQAGVTCYVKHPDHPSEKYQDTWDFLVSVLKAPPAPAGEPVKHSFLATGGETFIVDDSGKTIWSYPHASRDGWVLANGNVLLALSQDKDHPGGSVVEVNRTGKVVFEFMGSQSEVNTVQLLGEGKVLLTEAGNKPRILEVGRDGKIVAEVPLQAQTKDHHLQTRMTRKLPSGNYLVPQLQDRVVREYDPTGKIVWEVKTPHMPFTAIRLPDGHTLIGCTLGNLVIEVDKDGKEVWRVTNDDLPNKPINDACGVQRLDNGDTVITSHHNTSGQPKLTQVNRDKKVVWTYTDSRKSGIHHFQILDSNGKPEGKEMK